MAIQKTTIGTVLMAALLLPAVSAAAETPIAGVNPDRRPDGAPTITEVTKDKDWYQGALRGVSEPYPSSLKFLENQGNWYTPFSRRGMPGPYDIRGLHSN